VNLIAFIVLVGCFNTTREDDRVADAHNQTRDIAFHPLQLLRAGLHDNIRDSREQPRGAIRELPVLLSVLLHLLHRSSSEDTTPREYAHLDHLAGLRRDLDRRLQVFSDDWDGLHDRAEDIERRDSAIEAAHA
jgi:hypothetical protein